MVNFQLEPQERIRAAINLGESHFREFKSALEGAPEAKSMRDPKTIKRDIGETLVAFANADGGELLVGVEDDGTVTGIPHSETVIQSFLDAHKTYVHHNTTLPLPRLARVEIDGKKVLYFAIEKSTRLVHLTNDGRCLQRRDRETLPVASEQIRFERQEQISREYDRQFIDGVDCSSLDLDILHRICNEIASGMSIEKLLQLLDIADFSGTSVRLRRAALLLFAKDVRRWHPRSEVRVLRVAGTEIKAGKDYNVVKDEVTTGSVFALMSLAWEALRPHLVQTRFGPGGIFEECIMYPEDACREALTNAISHRDYSMEGRGVEVFVYDDRMEVRSPGALLSNVSIDELKKLKGLHQSRNALIARVLRELGYMREMGEGFRRIYKLMKDHDLVEPDLSSDLESFTITLHHKSVFSEDAQRWINAFEKFNLTGEEQKLVLLGRDGTLFSPQQVWDTLDIVDTEDYRVALERLRLKGILVTKKKSQAATSEARAKNIPRKNVARFGIQYPQKCEGYFAELMKAFQEVGPEERISTQTLLDVANNLNEYNPYKLSPAYLSRLIQHLGLADSKLHPMGPLRSLWEAHPKRFGPRPAKVRFIPAKKYADSLITEEEKNELLQETAKRVLYIGNLSNDVTEKDLKELFVGFGSVRAVRIPKDFYTGGARGFAFVEFEHLADAKVAKETLAGRSFRGRILYLEYERAKP